MANPTTPYGFEYIGLVEGAGPTFGIIRRSMGNANSSSIARGDPAILTSGLPALATVTGGTGAGVCGVFMGFEWPSVSLGGTVRNRAWKGTTADIVSGGVLFGYLAVNPDALFKVRATGASSNPITTAMTGNLINFAVGAGYGINLVSTYSADAATQTGSSATLPFKIYALVEGPSNDNTVLNNEIVVRWNPASFVQI